MSSAQPYNDYDAIVVMYTAANDSNAYNACYERPASLVLQYLQDWRPALREFHRVLRPGGRLVVSAHHPFMDHPNPGQPDYFPTYRIDEEWAKDGQAAMMRF